MRATVLCALACVAAGCDVAGGRAPQWLLVVDDAELAPLAHDGNHWCAGGVAPSVTAIVRCGAEQISTPPIASATPRWSAPMLVAGAAQWRRGFFVDVRGQCDGGEFRIGAVVLHPSAAVLERGGLALRDVGGLRALRLHFVRPRGGAIDVAAPAAWYPYDVAAGAPIDAGWPVYDDGADGYDDGSGDDGAADEGGGDEGGGDDGEGDAGGGEAGGDSGGDSRIRNRPPARPRVPSSPRPSRSSRSTP